MHWQVHHGSPLDIEADILVLSANVFLNLNTGLGAEFLKRYSPAMQVAAQAYLRKQGVHRLTRGDVCLLPPHGAPFLGVIHAVAVDEFFQTTPAVISETIRQALRLAAQSGAASIALAPLALGQGQTLFDDFQAGIVPLLGDDFAPIERVVIALASRYDVTKLRDILSRSYDS